MRYLFRIVELPVYHKSLPFQKSHKFVSWFPVYKRFIDTYHSTGFCQLSERQHQRICDQTIITTTQPRNTSDRLEENKTSSCHRHQVILRVWEAEDLETDIFTMRRCQFSKDYYNYSYFVGKSHLRNTNIIFRSSTKNPTKIGVNVVYSHEIVVFQPEQERKYRPQAADTFKSKNFIHTKQSHHNGIANTTPYGQNYDVYKDTKSPWGTP